MIIEKIELNLDSYAEEYISLDIQYRYKDKQLFVSSMVACPTYDVLKEIIRDNYIVVVTTKYNSNYLYAELLNVITDFLREYCTCEDDDEDSETYGQEIPDVCEIEDIMYDFKNDTKIFLDVIESIQNGNYNNNINQLTLLP